MERDELWRCKLRARVKHAFQNEFCRNLTYDLYFYSQIGVRDLLCARKQKNLDRENGQVHFLGDVRRDFGSSRHPQRPEFVRTHTNSVVIEWRSGIRKSSTHFDFFFTNSRWVYLFFVRSSI